MSLLLWSGGLDSTLVLHRLAIEQRDGIKSHPHGIRALSIDHPQVAYHPPTAKASRQAIKEAFRKKALTASWIDIAIQKQCRSWRADNGIANSGNPQLLLWLTTAVNYLEPDEDLYTGYIRGDDVWHSVGRLVTAFANLQELGRKSGKLIHPLEYETKADVIRAMKVEHLYKHCWWCEESKPKMRNGKGQPCGKCKSCLTNDTALWQIERSTT